MFFTLGAIDLRFIASFLIDFAIVLRKEPGFKRIALFFFRLVTLTQELSALLDPTFTQLLYIPSPPKES